MMVWSSTLQWMDKKKFIRLWLFWVSMSNQIQIQFFNLLNHYIQWPLKLIFFLSFLLLVDLSLSLSIQIPKVNVAVGSPLWQQVVQKPTKNEAVRAMSVVFKNSKLTVADLLCILLELQGQWSREFSDNNFKHL